MDARRFVPVLVIGFLFALSACDQTKRSAATTGGKAQTQESDNPTDVANAFLLRAGTYCGDTYLTGVMGDWGLPYNISQYNEVSVRVTPEALSEADQLNGIEFRGSVDLGTTATRHWSGPAEPPFTREPLWTSWSTYDIIGDHVLMKRNGEWLASSSHGDRPFDVYDLSLNMNSKGHGWLTRGEIRQVTIDCSIIVDVSAVINALKKLVVGDWSGGIAGEMRSFSLYNDTEIRGTLNYPDGSQCESSLDNVYYPTGQVQDRGTGIRPGESWPRIALSDCDPRSLVYRMELVHPDTMNVSWGVRDLGTFARQSVEQPANKLEGASIERNIARTAIAAACSPGPPEYTIDYAGTVYTVQRATSPEHGNAPLFLDAGGGAVLDQQMLTELTKAVWLYEELESSTTPMEQEAKRVEAFRRNYKAIERYADVQDMLVRGSVLAARFALSAPTGGLSLSSAIPGLTWRVVKEQITDLHTYLASVGLWELELAQSRYEFLAEHTSGWKDGQIVISERTEEGRASLLYDFYNEARSFDQVSMNLITALMPKDYMDLLIDALKTLGSEIVATLPGGDAVVTLKQLYELNENIVDSVSKLEAFGPYVAAVQGAERLVKAHNEDIANWVTLSAECIGG